MWKCHHRNNVTHIKIIISYRILVTQLQLFLRSRFVLKILEQSKSHTKKPVLQLWLLILIQEEQAEEILHNCNSGKSPKVMTVLLCAHHLGQDGPVLVEILNIALFLTESYHSTADLFIYLMVRKSTKFDLARLSCKTNHSSYCLVHPNRKQQLFHLKFWSAIWPFAPWTFSFLLINWR